MDDKTATFDGETFDEELDGSRLRRQLSSVKKLMEDGKWRSLSQISELLNYPAQSISARLRDLRKEKFGGHTVDRRRVAGGLYEYRLVLPEVTNG